MADRFGLEQLDANMPIADPETGLPTPYFLQLLFGNTEVAEGTEEGLNAKADKTIEINSGTGLTGGGDLSEDRTIDLDAGLDDLTDVDLTTPPTDGQVLGYIDADGTWQPVDQSGGGGGGGYFRGFFGASVGGTYGSGFATNGFLFTPSQDITITGVDFVLEANSSSDTYQVTLAEVDALSAAAAIVAIEGTSDVVVTDSTTKKIWNFPFSTPVVLSAGSFYLVAASITSGSGTNVGRVSGSVNTHALAAPAEVHTNLVLRYQTTSLSVSQTVDGTAGNLLAAGLQGTI